MTLSMMMRPLSAAFCEMVANGVCELRSTDVSSLLSNNELLKKTLYSDRQETVVSDKSLIVYHYNLVTDLLTYARGHRWCSPAASGPWLMSSMPANNTGRGVKSELVRHRMLA